jgi:hypothetical protein
VELGDGEGGGLGVCVRVRSMEMIDSGTCIRLLDRNPRLLLTLLPSNLQNLLLATTRA